MNGLATQGSDHLLARLMEVCRSLLLSAEPLRLPFEEELLQRANVTITYGDRDVLTRDDLFRRLYRTLEEQAVVRIRVFDYTQEHRYEEKYFWRPSQCFYGLRRTCGGNLTDLQAGCGL